VLNLASYNSVVFGLCANTGYLCCIIERRESCCQLVVLRSGSSTTVIKTVIIIIIIIITARSTIMSEKYCHNIISRNDWRKT